MNFTETTVPRKQHPGRYDPAEHEYPKTVFNVDGRTRTVRNAEEEDAAYDDDFSDALPVLRPALPQATLSTVSGAEASYVLLKKQFEETVREFNVKYADLEKKYRRATDSLDLMKMAVEQKDEEIQKIMGLLKAKAASTSVREAPPVQDPQS